MAKKKFKTPIDAICSQNKITDLRSYIYFKDEFIYATNGVVAIKQQINLHGYNLGDATTLHNQCIHKDMFKFMRRFPTEFDFVRDEDQVDIVARIELIKNQKAEVVLQHVTDIHGAKKCWLLLIKTTTRNTL